jgi:hypothetical protein
LTGAVDKSVPNHMQKALSLFEKATSMIVVYERLTA